MFSGRKTLPGQKNFMSIEEFRQLCFDGKLVSSSLPAREIDMCFCQAMMVQVDELYEKKHNRKKEILRYPKDCNIF